MLNSNLNSTSEKVDSALRHPMADAETGASVFIGRSNWAHEEGLRLDAATYASGGLAARDHIRLHHPWGWRRLDAVANIFNGPRFARTYVRDPQRGVMFLSSSDILLADLVGIPYLSRTNTPQITTLLIEEGWTLISCSGTIGRTAFVRPEFAGLAASQHVMRAVPYQTEIQPGYLFAFLSSAPAQAMIRQKTYGNVVQHIEREHIADLPVPIPDVVFQTRIHTLVTQAAKARTEASHLLDEAAGYFDELARPMPSSHDHAQATGIARRSTLTYRLDAFHHTGWAVESTALDGTPLGQIGNVTRAGTAKRVFAKRGVPFVSGIDVYQVRVPFRQYLMTLEAEKAHSFVYAGQILVQRSGQRYGLLGRPAYVGKRMNGWAASEDLMVITFPEEVQTARVFSFLRSEIGHRTLLRTSYGTSIPKLNPEGLSALCIPNLPSHLLIQAKRALELREQADAYEEQAIQEVEAWLG